MMGDIHKRQSFNHKGTVVAYCGSLVQQNFGEKVGGMDFYFGILSQRPILNTMLIIDILITNLSLNHLTI
jgi:hypothetical protein